MKELIKDLIIAIAVAAVLTLTFKFTIVKESSMEPTIYENNYLLINKLAYVKKEHPDYGDIVVFKSNIEKEDGSGKKMLIKRIIAVENDVISITGGHVYRNGDLLDEPYIMEDYTAGEIINYEVPEGCVFVMGDNRAVSRDSRSETVGAVSEDSIVGKAFFRVYPFNKVGRL